MISGAHIIIYSKDPEADRAFFRDVLKFPAVDAGHGGSSLRCRLRSCVSSSEKNDLHELTSCVTTCCDDEIAEREESGCGPVHEERWAV